MSNSEGLASQVLKDYHQESKCQDKCNNKHGCISLCVCVCACVLYVYINSDFIKVLSGGYLKELGTSLDT